MADLCFSKIQKQTIVTLFYTVTLISANELQGYGTDWLYFPDGNKNLHMVNFSLTPDKHSTNVFMQDNEYESDIEFKLYTRNNKYKFIVLDENAKPLLKHLNISKELSEKPIKIITHGWTSSADGESVLSIKNAYLEMQDVAVITLDWSKTADDWYTRSATDTCNIGVRTANFINSIFELYNVDGKYFHLIGHSLGAHVMGCAASKSHVRVNRVTGLDPARPLFEIPNKSKPFKLDSSDADFVDIIHTCSGILGISQPMGSIDFYPNNGIAPQPGCGSIKYILEACSHARSYLYFAASIRNPKMFLAEKCESWEDFSDNRCSQLTYMGDSVDQNSTGNYYLKTISTEPYGLVF